MTKLEKLLKESKLSDEAKALITEAWNEEKSQVAAEIRLEMKERYNEDHKGLVEGLNSLMNSIIEESMQSVYDEKRKLVSDRMKIRESLGTFSDFANKILAEEVKGMRQERNTLNESMQQFINFSNKILAEELSEFHGEKQKLVEQRIKLIAEGKQQIQEAKKNFVEKASTSVAQFLEESNTKLQTEFLQEIMEARQNMFGRKLFEAFKQEFHAKQFNENSILSKMNSALNESESKMMDMKVKLQEAQEKAALAENRMRIMEDKQARAAIISELTKPLTPVQKRIMENLLESTQTNKLKDDFDRYHKSVLKESADSSHAVVNKQANKVILSEGVKTHTGNRTQKIDNSTLEDDDILADIKKRAGI